MSHMRLVHGLLGKGGLRCAGAAIGCAALICLASSLPSSGPVEAVATSAPATQPTTAPSTGEAKPLSKLPLRGDDKLVLPGLAQDTSSGLLGKTVIYAMVVLLVGGAAIYVTRRFLPRLQAVAGRRIRVLDSTYLGPRRQLLVVQAGHQRFLLASCRDHVNLIAELTGSFEEAYEKQAGGELKANSVDERQRKD